MKAKISCWINFEKQKEPPDLVTCIIVLVDLCRLKDQNSFCLLSKDVDDCSRLEWSCENGGQAVDTGRSCQCECAAGYIGEHCQIPGQCIRDYGKFPLKCIVERTRLYVSLKFKKNSDELFDEKVIPLKYMVERTTVTVT